VCEQQKRHRRDDPGEGDEEQMPCIGRVVHRVGVVHVRGDEHERRHEQHDGLGEEALDRRQGHLALQKAVEGPRAGHGECVHGKPSVADGEHHYCRECEPGTHHLHRSKTLAEHAHSDEHGSEGRDEVAEGGLDDLAFVDDHDIGGPVD